MNNNPNPEQISVTDYFLVPLRHWFLVLTVLALMIALALWHNSRLVPIFQATATLLIDRENVRSPLTGQQMEYETYLSESLTFNSHYELITSQDVLKRVVKELGLDTKPDIQMQTDENPTSNSLKFFGRFKRNFPTTLVDFFQEDIPLFFSRIKKNVELVIGRLKKDPVVPQKEDSVTYTLDSDFAAVQALKGMVKVTPVEDTRLLNISVTHTDPAMSSIIANAVTEAYIQFNIDNRMKASRDTLAWLTKSLDGMKKNLEESEKEFVNYKESMNVISLENNEQRTAQEINRLNAAYIEARNNRYELEAKLKQLSAIKQSGTEAPNLRSLASSPIIESLHQGLVEEEMALSKAKGIYQNAVIQKAKVGV